MSESISTAAYYTVQALPFNPSTSSDKPPTRGELCRGFSVDAAGPVVLTREEGKEVTVQCIANMFYPLRFKLATGTGNILAVW